MAETTGQDGSSAAKARPAHRRVAQWMRDYARLPGIPDEYIGEDGPRPVWTRFFDAFANLSPADIERRFAAADRHLREAGVTYRAPGEIADLLWPLSHLPLLIGEADWPQLSAGIAQRAQLFELVLRDLYGEAVRVTQRLTWLDPKSDSYAASYAHAKKRFSDLDAELQGDTASV